MKSTRRELIKKAALGGTALAAINFTAACSKKEGPSKESSDSSPAEAKPENLQYVTPENTTAQALGYVEDASSLDEDKRADKGATKGVDQFCNNCQFYTSVDSSGGKCSLFPGKLVKSEAWCRSWSLKSQS